MKNGLKRFTKNQKVNSRIPIHYCIFIQDNQEQSLEKLNELNEVSEKRKDDFRILIDSFVEENRKNKLIYKQPYVHNLLSSLRQIEYSFSEFQEAKKYLPSDTDHNGRYIQEIETAAVLVFFFNAVSLIRIVQKYTSFIKNSQFNLLLEDIFTIRDHLAHSYEKDIYVRSSSKALVDLQIQRGLSLESLELTDLATDLPVGRLWFSLPTFYFSLKDIFKELKDNPKLFIKQGKL